MCNAKPQCFHVSGKNFTGNEKFSGNIYLEPEESPEDRGFCIVNNVMSPYDLYKILSGFLILVSKFSNLSLLTNSPCISYSLSFLRFCKHPCTVQSDLC